MEEEGQVGRQNVANLTEWATQWKEERLTRLQPWGDFFDRTKVCLPQSSQVVGRISTNLMRFQTNYLIVALILSLWCIISNPWFLVGLVVSAAMWFYAFAIRPYPATLLSLDLSDRSRALILLPITLLLFWWTSFGYTIFWLFGVTVAVVLGHAVLMENERSDSLQSKFQQILSF